MKKKARVAPMQQVTQEAFNMVERFRISPRIEEMKVELKSSAKKNWNLLKNTIRFKTNLLKHYEKLNFKMMEEKLATTARENACDCLLEHHEEHAVNGHTKRRKYNKSSIRHKETGKELISYFINMSRMEILDERVVDFDHLEAMFNSGVDINTVDRYGQSVLHEVVRTWHVDVARFLLENGSNINHQDDYGRTPLHVACAVDYPEMVELLLLNGADIHNRTDGEEQTPIHYAAKKDASAALKILLQYGANMNDVDYKMRTPLQLAAELDRSLTAELLLDKGAPAGVYDDSMVAAIVLMIQKMPHVALQALDQFYQTNRANRRQFFYLNYLVPPTEGKWCHAKSPLEVAVDYKQFQLLLHPVFQRLIEVKWQKIGKWGSWFYGSANFLLCLLWTTRLCTIPTDANNIYKGSDRIMGIAFESLAALSLLMLIGSEVREFFKAKKKNESYKQWREVELEKDMHHAHPRWPEERAYLEREMRFVQEHTSSYIRDKWNYFDWITYALMAATIILHGLNLHLKTHATSDCLRAIGSVMLLFLWLRMLKYARPFKTLGPFVVMLSHVIVDTFKIFHLSLHFFIPYIAAFWVLFGIYDIKGYTMNDGGLIYNIFQMMVVGDYDFDNLTSHSHRLAMLFCGTFIFFAALICLNLYIALMSNTFQRVYDNVKANAVMQRAASIIELEADISTKIMERHQEWISRKCAPESLYYDDDLTQPETDHLKRMTIQIKESLDGVNQYLEQKFGKTDHSETTNHQDLQSHGRRGGGIEVSALGGGIESSGLRRARQEEHTTDDATSSEVRQLVKTMKIFKAEYYKSMIQTRAEIAGLGLMLKEIIEQNAAKQEKQQTKRNYEMMNELTKSMAIKRNRKDHVILQKHDEEIKQLNSAQTSTHYDTTHLGRNTTRESLPDNKPINITENIKISETNETFNNISPSVGGENQNHTHNLMNFELLHSESSTEEAVSPEHYSKNSETNDLPITTSEGYFEGYTFNEKPHSDDNLIKATWNSIFSKIINQQNDSEENTSPKEVANVYVMHSALSTIEASGDDEEADTPEE